MNLRRAAIPLPACHRLPSLHLLINRNDILERLSRVLFVSLKCVCYIHTQSMDGTRRIRFR